MGIQLTVFETLSLPESDLIKQKYYQEQRVRAQEVRVDYQSQTLIEMGGLAVFCAGSDPEFVDAA